MNLNRSGPDEDFDNLCSILTEVSQMKDDAKKVKNIAVKLADRQEGLNIRDEALTNNLDDIIDLDDESEASTLADTTSPVSSKKIDKRKIECDNDDGITKAKKSQNKLIEYLQDKNKVNKLLFN